MSYCDGCEGARPEEGSQTGQADTGTSRLRRIVSQLGEPMTGFYYPAVTLSAILIAMGLAVYVLLFVHYRQVFDRQSTIKTLLDLISHVPSSAAGPGAHIFAGVTLVAGVALGLATMVLDLLSPTGAGAGTVVSLSGLLVGLVFAAVSLWTLWQTRRLDFQFGFQIAGFHDLIAHINKELDDFISSLQAVYSLRPQPFHRVYLVTTNPFLGKLSYPHSTETTKFRAHLHMLAQFAAEIETTRTSARSSERPLAFKILCGTPEAINAFHRSFFGTGSDASERAERASLETERAMADINQLLADAGGEPVFYPMPTVPKVQFMIIGNTLYEFTLDSQGSQTDIYNTNVVRDSRYCSAFVENFHLLLDMQRSQQGVGPTLLAARKTRVEGTPRGIGQLQQLSMPSAAQGEGEKGGEA